MANKQDKPKALTDQELYDWADKNGYDHNNFLISSGYKNGIDQLREVKVNHDRWVESKGTKGKSPDLVKYAINLGDKILHFNDNTGWRKLTDAKVNATVFEKTGGKEGIDPNLRAWAIKEGFKVGDLDNPPDIEALQADKELYDWGKENHHDVKDFKNKKKNIDYQRQQANFRDRLAGVETGQPEPIDPATVNNLRVDGRVGYYKGEHYTDKDLPDWWSPDKKDVVTPDDTPNESEPNKGGGGSGDGSGGGGVSSDELNQGSQEDIVDNGNKDFAYDDADRPYWESMLNTYRNRDPKDKFQFDDTYAPDSQGFRDQAGNIMDAGKVVVGALGATKKLDAYDPSDDFKQMLTESRSRRNMGMTQEARANNVAGMNRAYNSDVTNIRNMAGGSGGAAMANLGGASSRYYQAQNQMTALDEGLKNQNRDQFYQAAMAGEGVNQFGFQEERTREMMSKQAAGNLMGDAMDSIQQRREYEDTYKDPNSPFYQYQKELTLDARQNRELREFAQAQREKDIDQMFLDNENQAQEELNRIDVGKHQAYEGWKEEQIASGNFPEVQNSEDFKNYNGQPIVSTDGNNEAAFPTIDTKESFGMSREQMDKLSDEDLMSKNIERNTQTVKYTDPNTGRVMDRKINNYGTSEPMDEIPVDRSETDKDFVDLVDVVNNEFSERENKLRDELYLKDERKYNKELEKLKLEKKEALKLKQAEYLKQ